MYYHGNITATAATTHRFTAIHPASLVEHHRRRAHHRRGHRQGGLAHQCRVLERSVGPGGGQQHVPLPGLGATPGARGTTHASHIYPKMNSRQFALQVPQAFGKKSWSYPDANSERWWDEWSSMVAQEYFVWAQADPRIIGINPWYWGPDRPDISCGGYNVSITHLPAARAEWTKIGQTILASLNHSRVGLR